MVARPLSAVSIPAVMAAVREDKDIRHARMPELAGLVAIKASVVLRGVVLRVVEPADPEDRRNATSTTPRSPPSAPPSAGLGANARPGSKAGGWDRHGSRLRDLAELWAVNERALATRRATISAPPQSSPLPAPTPTTSSATPAGSQAADEAVAPTPNAVAAAAAALQFYHGTGAASHNVGPAQDAPARTRAKGGGSRAGGRVRSGSGHSGGVMGGGMGLRRRYQIGSRNVTHDDSAAELLFRITHQELTQDLSMELEALEEAGGDGDGDGDGTAARGLDVTAVAASRAADVLVTMCSMSPATSRST